MELDVLLNLSIYIFVMDVARIEGGWIYIQMLQYNN